MKPDDPPDQPDRTTCWLRRDYVRLAKEIAAREDDTVSEVIERLLRVPLHKQHSRLFAAPDTGGES